MLQQIFFPRISEAEGISDLFKNEKTLETFLTFNRNSHFLFMWFQTSIPLTSYLTCGWAVLTSQTIFIKCDNELTAVDSDIYNQWLILSVFFFFLYKHTLNIKNANTIKLWGKFCSYTNYLLILDMYDNLDVGKCSNTVLLRGNYVFWCIKHPQRCLKRRVNRENPRADWGYPQVLPGSMLSATKIKDNSADFDLPGKGSVLLFPQSKGPALIPLNSAVEKCGRSLMWPNLQKMPDNLYSSLYNA